MVIQEKRKNLEVFFLDFMVVKEKRRILGSSCFEIHGCIVMSILTQNWNYLLVVSWGKLLVALKLRKSGI